MTRIAVDGFLRETNTFAPTKAKYDDFVHGGGWPAMAQGHEVLRVMRNINVGLAHAAGVDTGPSAALRIGDVRVVVSSRRAQLADQSIYRYVGIEPTEQSILVNKSSVHFRADFEPIAEKLIICAAPGAMPALPWTRLRPGMRIKPNGPAFMPDTKTRSTSSATG
jgi:microcystin degradation protein MlrC